PGPLHHLPALAAEHGLVAVPRQRLLERAAALGDEELVGVHQGDVVVLPHARLAVAVERLRPQGVVQLPAGVQGGDDRGGVAAGDLGGAVGGLVVDDEDRVGPLGGVVLQEGADQVFLVVGDGDDRQPRGRRAVPLLVPRRGQPPGGLLAGVERAGGQGGGG